MRVPFLIPRGAHALILLLGAVVPVHAQKWTAGIKGGVGQGGFTGSSAFNWSRTLPTTSVFLQRTLTDRLSLQPELAHSRKVGVSNLAGSTLTLTADYLQMPLLVQLRLPSASRVVPFLTAGPSFGVKLKCTLAFEGGGVSSSDDCDSQRGVQSNRVDFGVVGGGGISFPFDAAIISLEGRYAAGLRSFVVPLDAQNSRSYGWSVLAGVSLPLLRPRIGGGPTTLPAMPPVPAQIFVPRAEIQTEQPLAAPATGLARRVTVNAVDVDARTLLIAIAKEAGLNVVVSSDVRSRVSVSLTNVLAVEAIQAIIEMAGLSVMGPQSAALTGVVFHQLPIDINKASPEVITARFGVSAELAKWIAASRPVGPP